jgi:hypothetical protein
VRETRRFQKVQEGQSILGTHTPNRAMNRAATALLNRRVGGSRRLLAGFTLQKRILRQK